MYTTELYGEIYVFFHFLNKELERIMMNGTKEIKPEVVYKVLGFNERF